MLVLVDETGSFRAMKDKNFGIVTLVTITDSELDNFDSFMLNMFPAGYSNIKGKTLRDAEREKILKYIGKKPEIKYTAFLYDLTSGTDEWVNYHRNETIRRTENKLEEMKDQLFPSYTADMNLFLNQIRKYSIADYAKYVMFTEIFIEWQQFFQFDYVYTHISRDSWDMRHVIDMQNEPNKFKRLVTNTMILTTNEQNPNYRIYTPKEWGEKHPFIVKHSQKDDIRKQNGRVFFKDLKITTEQEEPRLILPDLIGYIIMNSILKRDQKKWLMSLKRITQNRSLTMIHKRKSNYYKITGFNKIKNPYDVHPPLREHDRKMRSL